MVHAPHFKGLHPYRYVYSRLLVGWLNLFVRQLLFSVSQCVKNYISYSSFAVYHLRLSSMELYGGCHGILQNLQKYNIGYRRFSQAMQNFLKLTLIWGIVPVIQNLQQIVADVDKNAVKRGILFIHMLISVPSIKHLRGCSETDIVFYRVV